MKKRFDSHDPIKGKKLAIFGADMTGKNAYRQLACRCRIVGFVDNNPFLQEAKVLGCPVMKPEILASLDFDYVVICTERFHEIVIQLHSIGISKERILIPQLDIALDLRNIPTMTYLRFIFLFLCDLLVLFFLLKAFLLIFN